MKETKGQPYTGYYTGRKPEGQPYYGYYSGFNKSASAQIHHLAKTITTQGQSYFDESIFTRQNTQINTPHGVNPIFDKTDPTLDPESPNFSSKRWVQNMWRLYQSDSEYYKPGKLGVAYKNLRVYGDAIENDYQTTVSNGIFKSIKHFINKFKKESEDYTFDILKPMEGLIKPGEVTVVLGRPGAGCTTFLKTIACHTEGFKVADGSIISYDGITPEEIKKNLRGEVVYCAETETHFPNLTVGQTLEFTALMKTPRNRPLGVSREDYAKHIVDVVMATYGLSHTKNTKVGNDFVRGVSGGERKRVSIAEVSLVQASIQCWDNSTRGLDSATALEFISSLKTSASILNDTPLIAIYQCSQDAYDLFDKVIVMYEGYQIFFGSSQRAAIYFQKMGFVCEERQTTPDFLTSITNPAERIVKPGFEKIVPRTPKEFYRYWRRSPERQALLEEIDEYLDNCENYDQKQEIFDAMLAKKSKNADKKSPYTVSLPMQVRYIMKRNWDRMRGDPSVPVLTLAGNIAMSLILASVFYNLKPNTGSFYYRTAVMYYSLLFNAYSSVLEIYTIYEGRPIVQKHKEYALYPPMADAIGSIFGDLPLKLITSILFNLILYFMVNFKREPGAFFFYLLINFLSTLMMSHLFRTIGAYTRTLAEAMTPSSILLFAMSTFTGFAIPITYMLGWCKWIHWINPLAYAYEALISNEFHGRTFECSSFVPSGFGYPTSGNSVVCASIAAIPGSYFVDGDLYIQTAFSYYWRHAWRDFGILLAFVVFLFLTTIICVEYSRASRSKGEILVYRKKHIKKLRSEIEDEEAYMENQKMHALEFSGSTEFSDYSYDYVDRKILETSNVFHWKNLTYTLKVKGQERTILNDIDGWVKPGEVTALMGASGAGKTTLLNALSERLTVGVITNGSRMVNGCQLDNAFQRSIGYVQQQDLHLETSTVREALRFSAYLRQPNEVPRAEKDIYVEKIIELMEMEQYAEAVVGVPGEGLNVEQRKRLTIAVELVARPKLLLFLDEPTSGLDSQTAWSICKLIRKLANHGQAILCTIHQPSSILLEEFDRLLFLRAGGETVYFGEFGYNCKTLINYFERNGAPKCPPNANPAEWMLHVIGAAPGSQANQDYFEVWRNSKEYKLVQEELHRLEYDHQGEKTVYDDEPDSKHSYASPIWTQYYYVLKRLFQQYWRTPSYIYSKFAMAILCSLFNGFTFYKSKNTMQGLQNQMLSIFMLFVIITTIAQQYVPMFVSQRDLYEAKERPAKTFSWLAFILAQITAEIPYQIVAAALSFFSWYYPVGMYRNAGHDLHARGALMWLSMTLLFIYSSTLAQMCISFNQLADNAANGISVLITICMTFCGVIATKDFMPRFWIFLYRFNPFTYLVSSMLSIGIGNSRVRCSEKELIHFPPQNPGIQKCKDYMGAYISIAGGYLTNPEATDNCTFCRMDTTNQFLSSLSISIHNYGRDTGVFIAFIVFNMIMTAFLYWLFRVPKGSRAKNNNWFARLTFHNGYNDQA
ncbi:CDR3 [Candida jiufengensis]|uniref:CDR3 n=1 Tax=Candida jiufengensis TaxID=497108 RepID=UPI002224B2F8|nr:CDR3 [Candida jiufengensis]KAI5955256.1 CDR3 [Candida jiufengensis]